MLGEHELGAIDEDDFCAFLTPTVDAAVAEDNSAGVAVAIFTAVCMEDTNDEMGLAAAGDTFISGSVVGVGVNVHTCCATCPFDGGPVAIAVFGGTIQNVPIAFDGIAHIGTRPPAPAPVMN